MKQQLKNKSLKSVILVVIVLLLLGGGMLWMSELAVFKLLSPPKALDDLPADQMVGQYVTYDVTLLYDSYAYTTETTKGSTKSKVVSSEYVVPVGWEDGYFMGMVADKKYIDQLDTLLEESFAYLDGGPETQSHMTVTGTVLPMDEESLAFFYETVGYDEDPSDTEYQDLFLPYYLKIDHLGSNELPVTLVLTALGVGILAIAIIMLTRALTGGYQKSITAYCKQSGDPEHTLAQIEQWYETAEEINGLRVGPRWTMAQQGAYTHLLDTDKIVWAYLHRVTHRTNGIKTSTNYSLILRTLDHKKYEASMRTEAQVLETLGYLEKRYPNIFLGYDKSLESVYKDDPTALRRLAQSRLETVSE